MDRFKERDLKEYFTAEYLVHGFKSQFDLVAQSIKIAENMVKTGRSPRIRTDIQNPAYNVLQEVLNDYTDIPDAEDEEFEEEEETVIV